MAPLLDDVCLLASSKGAWLRRRRVAVEPDTCGNTPFRFFLFRFRPGKPRNTIITWYCACFLFLGNGDNADAAPYPKTLWILKTSNFVSYESHSPEQLWPRKVGVARLP